MKTWFIALILHSGLLYLLSLSQENIKKSNNLYNEIISNDKISLSIKERVKKINGFEKYQ